MEDGVTNTNFEPPNPSMFRSRNENERIGLLIRRIIPQKKAIRNEEHLSAIFKLKRALRNRNDENIDDIDLHYDEKNDYTLKKRKEAREAGDSPPDGSISLFGGAVTIAPQHGKDKQQITKWCTMQSQVTIAQADKMTYG